MSLYTYRVYELSSKDQDVVVSVSTLEEAQKMRDFYAAENPSKKYAIKKVLT